MILHLLTRNIMIWTALKGQGMKALRLEEEMLLYSLEHDFEFYMMERNYH